MNFPVPAEVRAGGVDSFSARYYASPLGRFLSPDWSDSPSPIPYASLANPQSLNLYSYVLNNPATDTDADGHICVFGHSFLGSFGGSCSQAPKLPVKEGAAGAAAADGTLSNLDTQAILDGLRSDADAVISGAADFAGIATGTFGAVLIFSKPLNPGEDQIMARVRAQSSASQKKLGNLVGRAADKIRDIIRSRGGSAYNVNETGHWADRTLGEAAQAAVNGDRSAEKAIKIAKDTARFGQKN